jgi:hypothetical protein
LGGPVAAQPDNWQYKTAGQLLHAARLTPHRLAPLPPLALFLYLMANGDLPRLIQQSDQYFLAATGSSGPP